jgi:hypothetical protein
MAESKSAALPIFPLREQAGASAVATPLCGAHGGWTIMRGRDAPLSFAQFEREGIGEWIRDKIAASKRKCGS